MAARTGTGVGLGITVALCGIAAVGFFVTSLVFYGQMRTAVHQLEQYRDENKEIVKDGERNNEAVRLLVEEAKKPPARSLVGYMQEEFGKLSEKVGGSRGDTVATLRGKIERALGENGTNLLGALSDRDAKIAQLDRSAKEADSARQNALAQLQESAKRIAALQDAQKKTVETLNADVGTYKGNVDGFRDELNKKIGEMQGQVAKIKDEADREKVQLNNEISKARGELLEAQAKIRELTRGRGKDMVRPADESTLVDGEVIGLDATDNNVFINRGRRDKVVIGMGFEVFTDANAIRPDDRSGQYPLGKATVEVIRVDDNSSVARIVRNPRGNAIVKGDVIANPLYDPNKTYTFLVFGNFDTSGSDRPTPEGQSEVRTRVESWGGRVTDALTGDVDFLVLGSRPVLPPKPPSDAPAAIVENYIRYQRLVREYDRLLEQATAMSIPVLNENRLRTLLGR